MKFLDSSKRMGARLGLGALLAAVSSAVSAMPVAWQLNMPRGVTKTSQEVYQIHMWAFYVCCAIAVVVFGAMIIAMVRFRKSKGAVAAKWSHNTRIELIWTVVPIVILVVLAAPATDVMISMARTQDSQMTVKITGYQWKWRYEYVNWGEKAYHVNFVSKLDGESDRTRQLKSGLDPWAVKVDGVQTYLLDVDHPLVLPTDTKVRFVVTGDDVIHAWWVPDLGWKQDAIPGIINDDWTEIHEPGTYRGQCTELCGQDHGFMPIVVKAVPKEEFLKWLDTQEAALTPAPVAASTAATPAAEPPKG